MTIPSQGVSAEQLHGFTRAGVVDHRGLNLAPGTPPPGRSRHQYGAGPFARLIMPSLPSAPGVYLWRLNDEIVYVGQTRQPLPTRLGSNGYGVIGTAKTLAPLSGRRNGGQQTNCRVNALANSSMSNGGVIEIWYRVTDPAVAASVEREWMTQFGLPQWNRRDERTAYGKEDRPPSFRRFDDVIIDGPKVGPTTRTGRKYIALTEYLASRPEETFVVPFTDLQRLVDLPASAMKHKAWWANSRRAHSHAAAWLDAEVKAQPDLRAGTVRFERSREP